jgi:hypothetical protein
MDRVLPDFEENQVIFNNEIVRTGSYLILNKVSFKKENCSDKVLSVSKVDRYLLTFKACLDLQDIPSNILINQKQHLLILENHQTIIYIPYSLY